MFQLWKFEWNRRGTESNKREKWVKKNVAAIGNRTRDLSITDQMSVLTNQVHLNIQFRHIFDQKCSFTDSLNRLGSRFARTSFVPLEIISENIFEIKKDIFVVSTSIDAANFFESWRGVLARKWPT